MREMRNRGWQGRGNEKVKQETVGKIAAAATTLQKVSHRWLPTLKLKQKAEINELQRSMAFVGHFIT